MRFEEEQNSVPGSVPKFGAIFMSNSATKKECFKRNLLGLPSGMANFVKHVKAGMILFLFEFEKRELHGVFRATVDGAMNIVPHAYSSSGKQFPAQVKFTQLWYCNPLREDEFYDAIKENYFSKNKFNFGLSKDQVYKLLSLFSSRKLKDQPPQNHFPITKVPSYTTSELNHWAVVSTMYPGSFQPSNTTVAYTHNSDIQQSDYFFHSQLRSSSPLPHLMGPQVSNLSCSTFSGDANVTSTSPYDPDAPSINYWPSSSYDVDRSLNPVSLSHPSHNSNVGHIFPSVRNQSFLSCVEPVGTRRTSDVDFGFDYNVSMPLSGKHHEYSSRTNSPFFGAAYSETGEKDFSKNEGSRSRGVSFLEPSSTPGPLLECENSDGMDEDPSSYILSIYPSFVFDDGYGSTSQEKRDLEAFASNVPTLKQSHSQSQGHVYPVKFESIDHHDSYSLKPDIYRSSRNMYSGSQKNRTSVFSRLGVASKIHIEENDALDDNNKGAMDTSADEIMSNVHRSQYQWVNMSNHTQLTKDCGKIHRKKRQTTCNSELLMVQKISKEMIMNDAAENEDNDEQFAATTSFVDFKRRSEVRKMHGDTKISGCNENAEKIESGELRKRRKLIRPNFNKNELADVTCKMVEPHLLGQISHDDKYIEGERISNCREEKMAEPCGAPFRYADETENELSQKFGVRIMQLSVSPEEKGHISEEDLIIKDSVMDGVSQDLKNKDQSTGPESSLETHGKHIEEITASEKVDHSIQNLDNSNQSIGQGLSLETCKVNANVSISSETECFRGSDSQLYNFDKVYPLDGEIGTNMATDSCN